MTLYELMKNFENSGMRMRAYAEQKPAEMLIEYDIHSHMDPKGSYCGVEVAEWRVDASQTLRVTLRFPYDRDTMHKVSQIEQMLWCHPKLGPALERMGGKQRRELKASLYDIVRADNDTYRIEVK